ncbi:MAG: alpha/beta hydrolase [Pyrinomonadaceae bacterium]|nr:alpha/beta hydrolase [Pyrinomonadaceae bacterium]
MFIPKSIIISILALFVLVSSAFAQKRIGEWRPICIGNSNILDSKIYNAPREINVWVPPSYAKGEKKYSVLYMIDGGLEQDFHHISGLAQLATINLNFEELIVVGIKTENRYMELTSDPKDPRYISKPARAGQSGKFFRHIKKEVIPYVEKNYRTGDKKVLIGESLAGLFVSEVFLRHPETFTGFISISPSLWWDDKALAKSAPDLLKKHEDKPRQLYLTMANEGGTMQRGLDMILEAVKNSGLEKLKMIYVDRSKTDTHSTIYHPAALDALKKLFPVPQPEPGETPWYLIEGGQPPEKN